MKTPRCHHQQNQQSHHLKQLAASALFDPSTALFHDVQCSVFVPSGTALVAQPSEAPNDQLKEERGQRDLLK